MVNVSRLRYWFATATILVVVVVAGFYFYARYRFFRAVKEVPAKLGFEIQQSTESFSLSKSEGGRTLFTIRASKAVQYKQGGRAELHNVDIIVYGRDSDRFDQIYGDDFEYDQQTGNVLAKGVVHIDLEANPEPDLHPGLTLPRELKNPIHLKTSGLVFNQKSGIAKTDEEISFDIPQASGAARGAYYDSKSSTLTLNSDINVQTRGTSATKVVARHGVITKEPRRAVLDHVMVDRAQDTITADKATLFLREDNSLDHVVAEWNVETSAKGETGINAHAPRADFQMNADNQLKSALMGGGVDFSTSGANQVSGKAGRIVADFGRDAELLVIHCTDEVRMQQLPSSKNSMTSGRGLVRAKAPQNGSVNPGNDIVEITAHAMDFLVRGGHDLDRAETLGSGQITITPQEQRPGDGSTTVTAGKLTATFRDNRLSGVHGAPQARVVQTSSGQPDKVSTSDSLDAVFDRAGAISGFVQQGSFQYTEAGSGSKAGRAAWARKATYETKSQILTLEGDPRVVDGGMATTAQIIRLNRATGDADAQSGVKTTYSDLKPAPGGALLAASDPIHVTGVSMKFARTTGIAHYTGGARLWQGANIIEAPSIDFNRDQRSMLAQASGGKRVAVVLVQQEKSGKMTPVNVSATRLTYSDQQRVANFSGSVVMLTGDGRVTADRVNVFLKARQAGTARDSISPGSTPSELDHVVAEGHVNLHEPTRRGTGERLVYTAEDAKFVLTGGPPSIFDAQHGTVTGAALTFYSHDDRVLVEGGPDRAVTKTRVSK